MMRKLIITTMKIVHKWFVCRYGCINYDRAYHVKHEEELTGIKRLFNSEETLVLFET